MTENEVFFAGVELANDNPKLYEVISQFIQFINGDHYDPRYMETAMRDYFGMTKVQIDAWLKWYFASRFGRDSAEDVAALKDYAVDVTIRNDPWPGLFELHRHDGPRWPSIEEWL